MTNGLAQALNGNFASLTRVGFVLDENTKKQIRSGTETERANALVKVLNSTYKDFNANLRLTDAGQMQVLANAAQEATTIIGTGLVDALKEIGRDRSVENLAEGMEDFALYTADGIRGVGILTSKLQNIPAIGGLGIQDFVQAIPVIGAYVNLLVDAGRSARLAKDTFNFASGGGAGTFSPDRVSEANRQKKLDDAERKRALALAKVEKDRLKISKEQAALKKAGTVLDMEQAQIVAALKGQISEDERKRLELQLALITGNTTEASKLAGELGKAQGLSADLIKFLKDLPDAKNPFKGWKDYLDAIESQVMRIATAGNGGAITGNTSDINLGDMSDFIYGDGPNIGKPVMPQVNVQVTLDGQELTNAISRTQTNNSLSGDRISVNRRTGSFATP
jgi:hypothetical protein